MLGRMRTQCNEAWFCAEFQVLNDYPVFQCDFPGARFAQEIKNKADRFWSRFFFASSLEIALTALILFMPFAPRKLPVKQRFAGVLCESGVFQDGKCWYFYLASEPWCALLA